MTAKNARTAALELNGIAIGMYPDEGDAGGSKTYLSALNRTLADAAVQHADTNGCVPVIATVGWYAQTYPGEEFNGFQLLPMVEDLKQYCLDHAGMPALTYEVSIMPFQSWSGYSAQDNRKAVEVANVMKRVLEESRLPTTGEFAIHELRLRFGHEVNYYITSGMYPAPTLTDDPGADFKAAFVQVAAACRALPAQYSDRIKMFYCPNIAAARTSDGALREYETFLPPLDTIDYVGIDYYCPAFGCLADPADLLRKLKPFHDKYSHKTRRPFIIGETGLQFDDSPQREAQHKLTWLALLTSAKVRAQLPNLTGINWFNYQKDRDYRILYPSDPSANTDLMQLLFPHTAARTTANSGHKLRKFWNTLVAKP